MTDLTAMLVPAPGLLSTITGCPRLTDICWPTERAIASTAPPAVYPTTIRIGFNGKASAACALPDTTETTPSAAHTAMAKRWKKTFIR